MTDDTLELIYPFYNNNPGVWPRGMEPYYPSILSPIQHETVHKKKVNIVREDEKYLGAHPEVNAIVVLILRAVLARRPKRLHEFVASFMSRSCLAEEIASYLRLEMDNTVVELEAQPDDDKETEELEEDAYQPRVSRVSFQVEKNTTTFFDEFSSSAMPQEKDNTLFSSSTVITGDTKDKNARISVSLTSANRMSRPNTKLILARSVSDYYLPTEEMLSSSTDATILISSDETFTASTNQSVDVSAVNMYEPSQESIAPPEGVEEDHENTLAAIQNKLETVCSDFRYISQDESAMYMHIAGVADRRRSVLPTREALNAAGFSSSNSDYNTINETYIPSAPQSRRSSFAGNLASLQTFTAGLAGLSGMSFGGSGTPRNRSGDNESPTVPASRHGSGIIDQPYGRLRALTGSTDNSPTRIKWDSGERLSATNSSTKIITDEDDERPLSRTPSAAQSVMPVRLSLRSSIDKTDSNILTGNLKNEPFSPVISTISEETKISTESGRSHRSRVRVAEDGTASSPPTRNSVTSAETSLASLRSLRNSLASIRSRGNSMFQFSAPSSAHSSAASMRSRARSLVDPLTTTSDASLASVHSVTESPERSAGSVTSGVRAGSVALPTGVNSMSSVKSRAESLAPQHRQSLAPSYSSVRSRLGSGSYGALRAASGRQTSFTEVPDIAQAVVAYAPASREPARPSSKLNLRRTPSAAQSVMPAAMRYSSGKHSIASAAANLWRDDMMGAASSETAAGGTAEYIPTSTREARYSVASSNPSHSSSASSTDEQAPGAEQRRGRQLSTPPLEPEIPAIAQSIASSAVAGRRSIAMPSSQPPPSESPKRQQSEW